MRYNGVMAGSATGGITEVSPETVSFEGLAVPAWFEMILFEDEWPADARIVVRIDPDTGPIATLIEALPRESSTASVSYRDVDEAVRSAGSFPELLRRWTGASIEFLALQRMGLPTDEAHRAEVVSSVRSRWQQTLPQRRRRVTKEILQEAADVYRLAVTDGMPPTLSVAEHFRVSHSTAARWVRRAREIGALGKARGSNPGGTP
jgi:hypothetical protein